MIWFNLRDAGSFSLPEMSFHTPPPGSCMKYLPNITERYHMMMKKKKQTEREQNITIG